MSARLCLVDDDPRLLELVGSSLRDHGFEATCFENPDAPEILSENWDIYVLDVLMNGTQAGFELCERIKGITPHSPVLLLSALSDPSYRISGLRYGADDYLGKPFEMEELVLRLLGMLKRREWYASLPRGCDFFEWDQCRIDFVSYEARRGRKIYKLSQKECMLMKLFVERQNDVITRDEILNSVWGYHVFPSTRTVDNFVVRLRKIYGDDSKSPSYFHSVRGVGYRFTPGASL